MLNADLARTFARIADLMEIDGESGFRINSYRRAARSLKDVTADIAALAADGRLTEIPGVGKGTADKIDQYIKNGTIDILDELEAKLPSGLPDLLEIQGLGPKKVALFYEQLGIESLDDLKSAIAVGKLEDLKGFGQASIQRISDGIAFLESSGGRQRLGEALMRAEELAVMVATLPGVKAVEIAGSVRRGKETSGDVDILCAATDGAAVIKRFTGFDVVKRVLASGATKGSVTVELPNGKELQVDLRVVDSASFGAALQYFTGSKEHNVRLRESAVKKGWRLNEYGLYDGDERIAGADEEEIYHKIGLELIPPELREDRYEFTGNVDFDSLVTVEDIRGDLHMHTVASDGKNTIEEMAQAARARGYEYIAICDHSKSSTIANGLSIERMEQHIKDIREANRRVDGIEILVGTECDILPNGSLDYPDDLLAQTDWAVASIHAAMGPGGSGKLSPTERTLAAMENRYICQIAHPTGRLINKRAAMEMDMATVVEAAVRTKTFLEINASWYRLDLKDVHVRQALDAGATLAINTDAHHTDSFEFIRFGVMTARRGAARRTDVLNTLPLRDLLKRIAAKRG
ncbi:MAG: DNA polymerase/3'-5' exonuclease PolX [Planctomycetota bacterium]